MPIPKIMTIAGSDSGGGAGIQADLKTIAALGGYGTSVITAITAQNTKTVTAIHEIPTEIIEAEYKAIMSDIGADAIKIGMLSSPDIISMIASLLREAGAPHIIVDPVMISKSGAQLLRESAVEALINTLLPLCTLLTPNIPEAEKLTGLRIESDQDIEHAASVLHKKGIRAVLIKGGHLERPHIINTLFDGDRFYTLKAERLSNRYSHGTGCTLSSAIATHLGWGKPLHEAVDLSIRYVSGGMQYGYDVGNGINPLNHMFNLISPRPVSRTA
jgi:hydroxymethylpyrimidine kinase/phosphomethylpyrimidine kinase